MPRRPRTVRNVDAGGVAGRAFLVFDLCKGRELPPRVRLLECGREIYGKGRAPVARGSCIVRSRAKIEATITNARAFLAIQQELGTFDRYPWAFVDGRPIANARRSLKDLPAETAQWRTLSRDLNRPVFSWSRVRCRERACTLRCALHASIEFAAARVGARGASWIPSWFQGSSTSVKCWEKSLPSYAVCAIGMMRNGTRCAPVR